MQAASTLDEIARLIREQQRKTFGTALAELISAYAHNTTARDMIMALDRATAELMAATE